MKNNIISKTLLIFALAYIAFILLAVVIEYLFQYSLPLPATVLVVLLSCFISLKYFLTKKNGMIEKSEKTTLIWGSVAILTSISWVITFLLFSNSIKGDMFIPIQLIISILINYVTITIAYYVFLKTLRKKSQQ